MRVGAIELLALSDGTLHVEPEFYVGLDVIAHPDLLAADGRAHVPIGCFLLRARRKDGAGGHRDRSGYQ